MVLPNNEGLFSKACEYALKIMIYLGSIREEGTRAGLRDIAGAINSPEAFTAKILQQLVKSDLLQSVRGPSGGFRVKNKPVSLMKIVVAIDGEGVLKNCVLGLEKCSNKSPCPVHDKFVAVRDHLKGVLMSTHLSDLEHGVLQGNRFLKL